MSEQLDPTDIAQRIIGKCTCHEAYTNRGLTDPDCRWCDLGEEVADAIRAERQRARRAEKTEETL